MNLTKDVNNKNKIIVKTDTKMNARMTVASMDIIKLCYENGERIVNSTQTSKSIRKENGKKN